VPRNFSSAYQTHLDGGTTERAACWKVSRLDGVTKGFTTHVSDLVIDGVTYEARSGLSPTAIRNALGTSVDTMSMQAILSSPFITHDDCLAGRFDGASVLVFEVIYTDLSAGPVILTKGVWGELTMGDRIVEVEQRGLTQLATQQVGRVCSAGCTVREFGDSECGLSLVAHTYAGRTVSVATSKRVFRFVDATLQAKPAQYLRMGKVTFTSGANAGMVRTIKDYNPVTGEIQLQEAFRLAVAVGDAMTIRAGCDRRPVTCKSFVNLANPSGTNIENFRGTPFMPGQDAVLKVGA
jgi:uncharacterized phage protein (TIGR02218 family)